MIKTLALTLVFVCLSQTAVLQGAAQTRNSITKDDGVWVWSWSEDGNSLELTVRGDVQFADDYTSVKRMSAGSSLRLKEKRGGLNRRLEIESGASGMTISYSVDGQSRPYDAEAKAWFSRVLTEAVIQTGLDAGPRAQRILKDGGASRSRDREYALEATIQLRSVNRWQNDLSQRASLHHHRRGPAELRRSGFCVPPGILGSTNDANTTRSL